MTRAARTCVTVVAAVVAAVTVGAPGASACPAVYVDSRTGADVCDNGGSKGLHASANWPLVSAECNKQNHNGSYYFSVYSTVLDPTGLTPATGEPYASALGPYCYQAAQMLEDV